MNSNPMQSDHIERLEMLVMELIAAFPSANVTPTTIVVYAADLVELPIDDLDVVTKRLRRTAKFLPTISEIYEAVEAYQKAQTKKRFDEWEAKERESREAPGEPMPDDIRQLMKQVLAKMSMR